MCICLNYCVTLCSIWMQIEVIKHLFNNPYINPNMKTKLTLLFCCFVLMAGQALAQEIEQAVLCKNVENHEAVEPTTTFQKGEKAWCWIKVVNAPVDTHITVNWYHGDELKHSTELAMKYESMRTYAYKTLYDAGKWRVDIVGADGTVLKSLDFEATE